jgi:hypothetical protein
VHGVYVVKALQRTVEAEQKTKKAANFKPFNIRNTEVATQAQGPLEFDRNGVRNAAL